MKIQTTTNHLNHSQLLQQQKSNHTEDLVALLLESLGNLDNPAKENNVYSLTEWEGWIWKYLA